MSYPSVRKRSKFDRQAQLPLIAAMHLRGVTQVEIAKRFGLTQSQISRDLKAYYRHPFPQTPEEKKDFFWKVMARLLIVEKELWAAWDKSKEDKVVRTITKIRSGTALEEPEME